METVDLQSWVEFKQSIAELQTDSQLFKNPPIVGPLFRGQGDSDWKLETTLERFLPGKHTSLISYHRIIHNAIDHIEAYTGKTFKIETENEFNDRASNYCAYRNQMFQADSYMVYLRQFGFPSPLLDWSKSPYIAAYFAFSNQHEPQTGKVAVYYYLERSLVCDILPSSGNVLWIGHYLSAHQRHFTQQSEYIICVENIDNTCVFQSLETFLDSKRMDRFKCIKFTIPFSERKAVLQELDHYNINDYTLFQTEESLLKAIAIREMIFA